MLDFQLQGGFSDEIRTRVVALISADFTPNSISSADAFFLAAPDLSLPGENTSLAQSNFLGETT
jgi:hypothetical protein